MGLGLGQSVVFPSIILYPSKDQVECRPKGAGSQKGCSGGSGGGHIGGGIIILHAVPVGTE
eukprot:9852259-Ditylum_brightwellii.AAC.1